MVDGSSSSDEINKVLLECEDRLRVLHAQGRLTGDALTAFVDLTSKVRREMERRRAVRQDESHSPNERRAPVASGATRGSPE
jgi:hypothetical protein